MQTTATKISSTSAKSRTTTELHSRRLSARSFCFGRFVFALMPALMPALLPPRQPAVCVEPQRVSWTPARPRAGSLFEVRIRETGDSLALRTAEWRVAGVSLHPESARRVTGVAVVHAAVPIDSVSGATLRVVCAAGVQEFRIPTDSGSYRLERLRVAPRFSAPPDSALAARLEREAAAAAAVSEASHETPVLWRSPFAVPRPSRITSSFGSGRMFNGAVVSRHMGTDYAGAIGAPVRAANRGVVRLTGAFYLGGNVVYVDHGAGFVTAYLHLSRTLVAVGDTVDRGEEIGRVGATGRVTGPHLHFIARYGGITVDPLSLIGRR